MEHRDGLVLLGGFAHRGELQLALLREDGLRQGAHEFEDTRVGGLVLAEGLVVHEEVDHFARGLLRREPLHVLVGRQRPLVPTLVREAEGDVVREFVVAQQQTEFLVHGVGVDVVGRLPAQHVLGSLGKHRAEAHFGDHGADVVRVDQLRIAEGRGFHAELLLEHGGMELDLLDEVLLRRKRCERVGVGLGEELHAARGGELLERVEDLGGIGPHLFDGDSRDGERAAEFTLVFLDELQQQGVHRQVALPGHLLHDGAVQQVVQVVVVLAHVEEAVFLQTPGLMYLKIETNGFHKRVVYVYLFLFSSITAS